MAHTPAQAPTAQQLRELATYAATLAAALDDGDDVPTGNLTAQLAAVARLARAVDTLTDRAVIYARQTSPQSGRPRATWAQLGEALGQDPTTAQKRHDRATAQLADH